MIQKPYKKTKNYNKFLILIVYFMLLGSQSPAQDTDITSPGSFEFDQYDTPLVATVANIDISAKEFMLSYEFGPAFLKRSKDSKKRYLMVMIYEKLLAIEGYKKGLDSNKNVVRSVKAYTDDIMTEELFKDEVMSQVKVSNTEIEDAIPLEKIQVSLRWLYTADKKEIFNLWNIMNSGTSFDSLFALQFNNEVSESDRVLNSSYFQLQQKNPQLAAIVNNLIPGDYSKPIHVDDGWYIVQLENILTNVLMTETEMTKARQELERSIFKQKLDIASDRYIQELMNAQNPVIDQNAFSRVVYYLNKEFLYPNMYEPDLLGKLLPQPGDDTNPDINIYSDQILIRSKLFQIRLHDFVDWFRPRMAYLQYSSDSAENFILSVQQIIWRMVRDYLLVQRAKNQSLDDRKSVKIQAQWWQDKIVYNAVKSQIAQSVTFTENDLRNYYSAHSDNYLDTNDNVIDFERAKGNVRSDYIREKYMDKIMREVLSLKQTYKIEIFDDVLKNLNVEDEENPKAIDMFIVKKGGLLPRQPYPTIDWEWQQWY